MVTVDECMQYAIELMKFGGVDWLAMRIGEISDKHSEGKKLTQKEKFIIGLRYSEFLAKSTTDNAYYEAERKRQICLVNLGITCEQINAAVLNLTGLH